MGQIESISIWNNNINQVNNFRQTHGNEVDSVADSDHSLSQNTQGWSIPSHMRNVIITIISIQPKFDDGAAYHFKRSKQTKLTDFIKKWFKKIEDTLTIYFPREYIFVKC